MEKITVNNMDLEIDLHNKIISVIGPSGSGKTKLALKLINKLDNSDIYIDGENIKNIDVDVLKHNIVAVLDDDYYMTNEVSDELFYYLLKLNYTVEDATKRIEEIAKHFKLIDFLDKRIDFLNIEDKILVKILSLLIIRPSVFIVDNLICYLSGDKRDLLLKYVIKHNICLINLTNNSEELLFSNFVIVLNNLKQVMSGDVKSVLDGNSILPYMGIKLPFIVDLSQNLILYNVIDKVYFDNRKLVDKLWK